MVHGPPSTIKKASQIMKPKHIFTLFLLILACKKAPLESNTYTLSGTVGIEGESVVQGINVALFPLAELDTALVNMHKRFPSVGFEISQATEFDHRLSEPDYVTQTDESGVFRFEDIPEGGYNLVAEKPGYGWTYVTDVQPQTVTEPFDLTLYPELEVEGTINEYTVWPAGQHVVVTGDVRVLAGATLLIDKGTVVRFAGNYELTVEGQLLVYGEQDNMAWFTDDFFDTAPDSWKGITITGQQSEGNIQSARIEYAEVGNKTKNKGKATIKSSKFLKISGQAILATNQSIINILSNVLSDNLTNIRIEGASQAEVLKNIIFSKILEFSVGIDRNVSESNIVDNYIINQQIGLKNYFEGMSKINNNLIERCGLGIEVFRSIKCNIFNNTIKNCKDYLIYNHGYSLPLINHNNLLQPNEKFILLGKHTSDNPVDFLVNYNYWGDNNIENIIRGIEGEINTQQFIDFYWYINLEPILNEINSEAYPQ
jgi:parallel beta-helix repeat protein